MTPHEAKRVAEAIAAIEALERKEEALIEDAMARDGIEIERRQEASPAAVLGVRVVKRDEGAAHTCRRDAG